MTASRRRARDDQACWPACMARRAACGARWRAPACEPCACGAPGVGVRRGAFGAAVRHLVWIGAEVVWIGAR